MFHPRLPILISGSEDGSLRLWDVRAARPLKAFKGHQNTSKNFVRAHFGPARDLVLSGSEDGSICMWNVNTAAMVHRLRGHSDVVRCVRLLSDGVRVLSCGSDSTIRVWHIGERRCEMVRSA